MAVPGVKVKAPVVTELVVRPVVVAVTVNDVACPVNLQPAKVATPEVAVTGLVVQLMPAAEEERLIALVAVVTVLPEASCTATTGCVVKLAPLVAPAGAVVKATWVAVPGAKIRAPVVTELVVRPVVVAVTVNDVACPVNLQPAKVATPEETVTGLVVQLSPAGVEDTVIELAAVVTVLPSASWTVTTGCVVKLVPLVAPAGPVVKATWVAAPAVTVSAWVPEVSPVAAAVMVGLPDLVSP